MSDLFARAASYGGLASRAAALIFGASGAVTLGDFVFEGFEIPAQIAWGGAQRLTVHTLPGGKRIIDAMGRDDAPLAWEGTFLSPDAEARALALDEMRVAGKPQVLMFGAHVFRVVVAQFTSALMRPGMSTYRISCVVLEDDSAAPEPSFVSTAVQVLADANMAAGFVSMAVSPPAGVSTAVAAAAAAAGASDFILGSATQTAAVASLGTAQTTTAAAWGGADTTLGTVAAAAPSGSIVAGLAGLQSAIAQAGIQAPLQAAGVFLARAAANAVLGAV